VRRAEGEGPLAALDGRGARAKSVGGIAKCAVDEPDLALRLGELLTLDRFDPAHFASAGMRDPIP
jgi:hypothetical protein